MQKYDLIIVGGGPAGAAAALYASRRGLSCVLLDKASFPRDKICGGALSAKSVALLHDLGLYERLRDLPGTVIRRVVFTSPDGSVLTVDMRGRELVDPLSKTRRPMEGLVVARSQLDELLFRQAQATAACCHEGFTVRELIRADGLPARPGEPTPQSPVAGVSGTLADGSPLQIRGRLVLGCDGFSSVVARRAGLYRRESRHWMVATRQYLRGVDGLTDQIELHFTRDLAPGYFWIFPAADGLANVGLGVDYRDLRKRGIQLAQALQQTISMPRFRSRFQRAQAVADAAGWNLPVGSIRRPSSSDGLLLLGDAAGLVDPFTGEGIGNALFSARAAVDTAAEALAADDVSAAFLRRYGERLWNALGFELRTSARLHSLSRRRSLLDWVVRRSGRSPELRETILEMMTGVEPRTRLLRPWFYIRLLRG